MRVSVYERSEDLPSGCLRLLRNAAAKNAFDSVEWYQNLARHGLEPDARVRFYALEQADRSAEAVGILPLRLPGRGSGWGGPRQIVSLSTYYTSLYGPVLAESGHDPRTSIRQLVDEVCSASPGWDMIQLSPLAREDAVFEHVVEALRARGMFVATYFCFGNWYLRVDGRTFDQYLESVPSILRNTLNRKRRKLKASRRAMVRIVTGGDELESAIADYERVYGASWKMAEPHPRFMPNLIRMCAEMGWLRLGLLHVDGEPAAAQVWIVNGGTASIYKLAYQDRFSDLSVGSILTAHLMEHAIDVDKVATVDYLTGDDSYKKDWMSHRRERWGVLALNTRTVRGLMGIARHSGGRLVRAMLAWKDQVRAGAAVRADESSESR
jgi:hypothetical protein